MTPGAHKNFWRATESLREAETLAQMAGDVSGPADEPPKSEADEQSWAEDWKGRALETLGKAREWAQGSSRAMKERAKRIVDRISSGVSAIRRATGQRLRDTLQPVQQALQVATLGYYGFATLGTIAIGWLVWKYLEKNG